MLTLWPALSQRHRYVLYSENAVPPDDFLRHEVFEHRIVPRPPLLRGTSLVREHLRLPMQIARDRIDLFFAPWYYGPFYAPCPTVIGVWDISYSTHRDQYPLKEGLRLSILSRRSSRRAAGIFTCSPYDKRQIEQHYGVPAARICDLPLAPDQTFTEVRNPDRIAALRKKYRLKEKYIVSLGVVSTRRHVDVIIDAFKMIAAEHPDVSLMVVGRDVTYPAVDIAGRMQPLQEAGRGAYVPWLPEDELMDLYHGASYYICVSTVDGEATMLKESMRCGTPVITSPLLEEAINGCALIVPDPTSRSEMADVLRRAITDTVEHDRLAAAGLEWSRALSWQGVAEMSLAFMESR